MTRTSVDDATVHPPGDTFIRIEGPRQEEIEDAADRSRQGHELSGRLSSAAIARVHPTAGPDDRGDDTCDQDVDGHANEGRRSRLEKEPIAQEAHPVEESALDAAAKHEEPCTGEGLEHAWLGHCFLSAHINIESYAL